MSANYIIIGEEGGTNNYSSLTNKPSINGVQLSGNKSLSDLGVAQLAAVYNTTTLAAIVAAIAKGCSVIAKKDSFAFPLSKIEMTGDNISKLKFSGAELADDVVTFHQLTVDGSGWSYSAAILAREEAGTTFATL